MSLAMRTLGRKNNGVMFEPDANTVLWMPGQEDAPGATIRDWSGNGNDGTIIGATWALNGQGLWYLLFDGIDNVVTVPHSASLSLLTACTLIAWVYPTDRTLELIMTKRKTTDGRTYFLDIAANKVRFQISKDGTSGANATLVTSASDIAANVWSLVMATYQYVADGSSIMKIYNNGVLDANGSTTAVGDIHTNTDQLSIGAYDSNDDDIYEECFHGGIALPRVLSSYDSPSVYNQERHLFGV